VTFVPGRHPLTALTAALAPHVGASEAALAARVAEDPGSVGRELRAALGDRGGLVVFVDQMEELVTMSEPAEAAQTAEVMGWLAAGAAGVRVLGTVRGDSLTRLASLPRFGDEVARALY